MDLLTPTETLTHCPYKGEAGYWSLRVGDDIRRRSRVVVPHAAAGEPEDRRAGQLLHGEGRPRRGRGQAGSSRPGFAFNHLFEHASDPAFVVDPFADRFVAANQAVCAMLGYALDELLATPVSRIYRAISRNCRRSSARCWAAVTAQPSRSPAGRRRAPFSRRRCRCTPSRAAVAVTSSASSRTDSEHRQREPPPQPYPESTQSPLRGAEGPAPSLASSTIEEGGT